MGLIFDFLLSIVDLMDGLYIFFFLPLSEVPAALFARFVETDSTLRDQLVTNFLTNITRYSPWLADFSLASILLGGGITLLLLWRVLKFVVPLLE